MLSLKNRRESIGQTKMLIVACGLTQFISDCLCSLFKAMLIPYNLSACGHNRERRGRIDGCLMRVLVSSIKATYKNNTMPMSILYCSQERMNRVYLAMVESVLATPYFYFSYTYDITHSQQRLHNTSPEYLKVRLQFALTLFVL